MDNYEKLYKKALERAEEIIRYYKEHNRGDEAAIEDLETIFPELQESEDERIRKEIISALKYANHKGVYDKHLAWLEKQGEHKPYGQKEECSDCQVNYAGECKGSCSIKRGEQKPIDKIETKFKVDDWVVVSTAEGDRVVQIASIEYFKDGHPSYFTTEGRWFGNGTKARLLTDKDVEIITIPESKIIVNPWSEEDDNCLSTIIAEFSKCAGKSVSKDEWMRCNDFLNSLKERMKGE